MGLSEQGKDGNKAKKQKITHWTEKSENSNSKLDKFGFMSSPNKKSIHRRAQNRIKSSVHLSKTKNNSPKTLPAPTKGIPSQKDKPNFLSKILEKHQHIFDAKSVHVLCEENKLNVDMDKLRQYVRSKKENKNNK